MESHALTHSTSTLGGIMYVASNMVALEWNFCPSLSLTCVLLMLRGFLREVVAW